MSRRILPLLTAGLLVAAPAAAHHGWSTYDATTLVKLTAPVLESSYEFPHGAIVMEVEGKRWDVVLAPPSRMTARGLPAADIAAGKSITVEGYASRVHDGEMRAERIHVDGRTVELR